MVMEFAVSVSMHKDISQRLYLIMVYALKGCLINKLEKKCAAWRNGLEQGKTLLTFGPKNVKVTVS